MATNTPNVSAAANFKPNPNVVVDIPASLIEVDKPWNMRYGRPVGDNDKDRGHLGTVESIACTQQNTPCTVRLNPDYPAKSSKPYKLCVGFGRFDAIVGIADGTYDDELKALVNAPVEAGKPPLLTAERYTALHQPDPTVRCVVKQLTDEQARWENVEENLGQNNVSGPDVCYAVNEVAKFGTMSHEAIAMRLKMSQGHVSTMIRVHKAFAGVMLPKGAVFENSPKMSILEHWRSMAARVPVKDLDAIGKLASKEEQVKAYLLAVTHKAAKARGQGGSHAGRGKGITNAIELHAPTMGTMLGGLARQGVIKCDASLFSGAFMAEILAPLCKIDKASDAEKTDMAHACQKAFTEALNTVTPEKTDPSKGTHVNTPDATAGTTLANGMKDGGDTGKKPKKEKGAAATV